MKKELFALPKRDRDANKGSFGKVLIVAGSRGMAGAAVICTKGALRSGAGLTVTASTPEVCDAVAAAAPEAMTLPLSPTRNGTIAEENIERLLDAAKTCDVVAVGCGLGEDQSTAAVVKALLSTELSLTGMVLDADGLNAVKDDVSLLKRAVFPLVITPHPGEMSRLVGRSVQEINDDRLKTAARFAAETGAVVLLKGRRTVVASPQGEIYINKTGNPALAKGGSGDLLTGVAAGLMASCFDGFKAASAAAYYHGKAADLAVKTMSEYSVLASDLADLIPFVIN